MCRLLFLLQGWDKRIDFSDQTVGEVTSKESTLKSYFGDVKEVLRGAWLQRPTSWTDKERALSAGLLARQTAVHDALCDNFNTAGAMGELLGIAADTFAYVRDTAAPDALLLKRGAMFVTRMLRIFGVITQDDFGFPIASGGGDNYEATVGPVISAMVGFRDQVREAAKAAKPPQPELLAMCDQLRDSTMVELGVRVEDRTGGSIWKLDDKDTLRKEVQAKLAARAEQAASKLLNKVSVKAGELSKAEAAAVPPTELFRQPQFAGKYGAFDDAGKPTADAKGEALSKAATKEVDKVLQKHLKEHSKHEEALKKNANYLDELRAELSARKGDAASLLKEEGGNLSEELKAQLEKMAAEAAAPVS